VEDGEIVLVMGNVILCNVRLISSWILTSGLVVIIRDPENDYFPTSLALELFPSSSHDNVCLTAFGDSCLHSYGDYMKLIRFISASMRPEW